MMRRTTVGGLVVTLLLGFAVSNCSAPSRIPAATVVSMPSEELREGRLLFSDYCSACHPGGRAGLGPSIINKPLPKALIRLQIRSGLGVMPAFKEHVLTDEQVRRIAGYVKWMRG